MILSFSTKWPTTLPNHLSGEPTFFVEKIWQHFPCEYAADIFWQYDEKIEKAGYDFHIDAVSMLPKKHTIRRDAKDRWKIGMDIHFYINARQKNMLQFAPTVKCKSIQTIEIDYWMGCGNNPIVKIDGISLDLSQKAELAQNDGFESVDDFFAYFNQDFKGKIIHWTNLKY